MYFKKQLLKLLTLADYPPPGGFARPLGIIGIISLKKIFFIGLSLLQNFKFKNLDLDFCCMCSFHLTHNFIGTALEFNWFWIRVKLSSCKIALLSTIHFVKKGVPFIFTWRKKVILLYTALNKINVNPFEFLLSFMIPTLSQLLYKLKSKGRLNITTAQSPFPIFQDTVPATPI